MEEKRKPLAWYWWTVAGLLALVAYPLSMGPVAWSLHAIGIKDGAHWAVKTAECAYTPIIILAESSPERGAILRRYIRLWVR